MLCGGWNTGHNVDSGRPVRRLMKLSKRKIMMAWLKVVALEIEAFEFRLRMEVQLIELVSGLESGYDEGRKNKTES